MDFVYLTMDSEGLLTEHQEIPVEVPEPTVVSQHGALDRTLVSTAFTPVCLRSEDGVAMPFETIVVQGYKSEVVRRYASLNEALLGHDEVIARLALAE